MDETAKKILAAIDAHRADIIAFAKDLQDKGESGFHETRTARCVNEMLRRCGLSARTELAATGVKAVLGTKGPCVAVIGELDGVLCPAHPKANKANGIAHACGHNLQLAALVGAAFGLSCPGVMDALAGSVAFFAVPAEEYVRAEVRAEMAKSHGIRFCCGKSELLRRGEFNGIDIALTTHVHMVPCEADLLLGNNACNGFVGKTVRIHGKAAHAAAAPHKGVNALNAAALSLSAIGMLRETFQEKDTVRIHTNILKGGDALNVVPDLVEVETQVRANNLPALSDVSKAFDNAFQCASAALGARAEIVTHQGYMPVRESPAHPASLAAAALLGGGLHIEHAQMGLHNMASTDVGDLTQVLPVINFTHGGVTGGLHSADFAVTDEEKAYIMPAKMMALTAYALLREDAALAKQTIADFVPAMTVEEYIARIEAEE